MTSVCVCVLPDFFDENPSSCQYRGDISQISSLIKGCDYASLIYRSTKLTTLKQL